MIGKVSSGLIGLLLGWAIDLAAQDQPIAGTIRDAETQELLPYATIAVSRQNRGTVSNAEGAFMLDGKDLSLQDTVIISYVGYETLALGVDQLLRTTALYLQPAAVNLAEVQVWSDTKPLSGQEIIDRVYDSFAQNHPQPSRRRRIFFHKYEKVPLSKQNQLTVKKIDFVGLDEATFNELFSKLPREFVEYQDAMVELYSHDDDHQLVLQQGVSLEEGSQKELTMELTRKLSTLMEDIEKTKNNDDIYYQFRTGIISQKIEQENTRDSLWNMYQDDSLHYPVKTEEVKHDMLSLLEDYAHAEGKNWEFVSKPRKYRYTREKVTTVDNELVYQVSFTPKQSGLFEGTIYVSADTYAVRQVDFAFADGKQREKIQLLGIGHALTFRQGRVIYEKREDGYFVKYVQAQQQETASLERTFSILKKQKRFLFDKALNELQLEAQLYFDIHTSWELMVLEQEPVTAQQFNTVKESPIMKFRKEYAYTPEMWDDRTIIVPTTELKKFKRSE